MLLKFIDADAVVIGPISIKVEIDETDGFETDLVEFYIDGGCKENISEKPYNWTFSERFFGICTIKAIAYSGTVSSIRDEIDVLILSLGGSFSAGNNNNRPRSK